MALLDYQEVRSGFPSIGCQDEFIRKKKEENTILEFGSRKMNMKSELLLSSFPAQLFAANELMILKTAA